MSCAAAFLALFSFYSPMIQGKTIPADDKFPFPLEIDKVIPANLLKNPGFETLTSAGTVTGWGFGNWANSPQVTSDVTKDAHSGKYAGVVRSKGDWPGYWNQNVKVQEGIRYYASVYVKPMMTDGTNGLRMHTSQYVGPGNRTNNTSHTTIQLYGYCGQGAGLEDFIDPVHLWIIRWGEWEHYEFEFIVPKGHKVDTYSFWAGLYGVGTVYVDDAYFGPAVIDLNGSLSGLGLKRLRILDQDKTVYLDQALKTGESKHNFKIVLKPRLKRIDVTRYQIEVTDAKGVIWKKQL